MRFFYIIALLGFVIACDKDSSPQGPTTEEPREKSWQLVWADEFDVEGLPDPDKWSFEVGGDGFGNNELQFYTDNRAKNARVKNGELIIEAHKESYEGNEYTSAKMTTRGSGEWLYGRVKVRARLPKGRGTWPAIWMMPVVSDYGNGGWPDNGEIDIMEHVGFDEGNVHCTIHCNAYNHRIGTQVGAGIKLDDVTTAYHEYSIEWSESKIEGFINDVKYFTFENDSTGWQTWPFDKEFYLILNQAVGGDWGGAQGVDPSVYPQQFKIDYVRVYQYK
jgi:beta-glucanase (GH16 family)